MYKVLFMESLKQMSYPKVRNKTVEEVFQRMSKKGSNFFNPFPHSLTL